LNETGKRFARLCLGSAEFALDLTVVLCFKAIQDEELYHHFSLEDGGASISLPAVLEGPRPEAPAATHRAAWTCIQIERSWKSDAVRR